MSENRLILFPVFIILLFIFAFIFSFYSEFNIIPFHFDIDTFVFYKVAHSINDWDFPVPESIGVSPLYPIIAAFADMIFNSRYALLYTNIFLTIIFAFFLFKTINIFKGKTFSLLFILACILNPMFLKLVLSGFSEISAYLFVVIGLYSFFKSKKSKTNAVSIPFFLLAAIVRLEFILFLPIIFLTNKTEYKYRKIFFYFILFFLLSSMLSVFFTESRSNPFVNKYSYIVFQLKQYLSSDNRTEFLNKALYVSQEAYYNQKIKTFLNEKKGEIENYLFKVPYYYLLNAFVVAGILIKNMWMFLIWIPLFILLKRPKIDSVWILMYISPLVFIIAVPLVSNETRYFTYLIPLCTFCFLGLFTKNRIRILYILILMIASFVYLFDYFAFSVGFDRLINDIRSQRIESENIMTDSSWIAFETKNKWNMPPPLADNPFSEFCDYLEKNKIKLIVLDPSWKTLGYSFYNNRFHKKIKESKSFIPIVSGRIYRYVSQK